MIHEKMSEFVIMLLLERLSMDNRDFNDYLKSNFNLDKFLKDYALNKSEKSE